MYNDLWEGCLGQSVSTWDLQLGSWEYDYFLYMVFTKSINQYNII